MDRVREIVISRKEVLDQFVWWYNTNDNLLYKYENGWELVIGKASQTQDGLMSKEDKILLDTYTGVASATTIAGYGITDAYTKTEVDTFIDNLGENLLQKKLNTLKTRIFKSGFSNKVEDADMIIIEDYWSPRKSYRCFL